MLRVDFWHAQCHQDELVGQYKIGTHDKGIAGLERRSDSHCQSYGRGPLQTPKLPPFRPNPLWRTASSTMPPSILPLALCALASLPFSTNAKMDPGAYAPQTNQPCPEALLRQPPTSNQTLHPNESQYLSDRRKQLPDAWRAWVGDGSNLGYDLNKLGITANNGSGLPVIGIALSGGGHRCVTFDTHLQNKIKLQGRD